MGGGWGLWLHDICDPMLC